MPAFVLPSRGNRDMAYSLVGGGMLRRPRGTCSSLSGVTTMNTEHVLHAPALARQPVSVTRKMAASLPELRAVAESKGLTIHHLGAGYPNPEVTDPRRFIAHEQAYFDHLRRLEGLNDPAALPDFLRESYAYTDTLGPVGPRESFAAVYGSDWGISMDPQRLIPTVGATGGISLVCSLFERPGKPIAYITDAPTYAGFLARAGLCRHARIYSVDMDAEGPDEDGFRAAIRRARADGCFVPFYYTVPDGHNPAGFSFSAKRRRTILDIAGEEGILIVEDAPYVYISYSDSADRPQPFVAMDPTRTVHLFTGSKIGLPGPRIGFIYTEAVAQIEGGERAALTDLLLTEASADILFQNPQALRSFESLMVDESFQRRESLWPVAEGKLTVYRENRDILLDGLERQARRPPGPVPLDRPGGGVLQCVHVPGPGYRHRRRVRRPLGCRTRCRGHPDVRLLPAGCPRAQSQGGLRPVAVVVLFHGTGRTRPGRRPDRGGGGVR